MIHFVKLGLGLAIVNDFCRIPAGLAKRPLKGIPESRYFVFHRPGSVERGPVRELKKRLLGR